METYLVMIVVIAMVWIIGTAILIDENKRLKMEKRLWKERYYAAAQINALLSFVKDKYEVKASDVMAILGYRKDEE